MPNAQLLAFSDASTLLGKEDKEDANILQLLRLTLDGLEWAVVDMAQMGVFSTNGTRRSFEQQGVL